MDLSIKRLAEQTWVMSDLLGRRAGSVEQAADGSFRVVPAGHAVEKLRYMSPGPFPSLNAALAAVETQTRGSCRLDGGDSPADIVDALVSQEPPTAGVIEMHAVDAKQDE